MVRTIATGRRSGGRCYPTGDFAVLYRGAMIGRMNWPAGNPARECAAVPGSLCRTEGCRRRLILNEAIRRVELYCQRFGPGKRAEKLELGRSMEDKCLGGIVLVVRLPIDGGS